jgi:cytochrome c-type biogenesis protein CcmH
MNGWVVLGLLSLVSLVGLILIGRLQRVLWQIGAAAILLAMTGYVLQGRPSLPSSPGKAIEAKRDAAEALILMRADMDQSFGIAKKWLVTADSFSRVGDHRLSAAYIQSGLSKYPKDADLWSALGVQLMLASEGQMSQPARLAFDKAHQNWPQHPAPEYFQGLAELFAGNAPSAVSRWEKLLETASPKAKWRPRLESQLAALKALQSSAGPSGN